MKNKLIASLVLALLVNLNSQISTVFAQGSVTSTGLRAPSTAIGWHGSSNSGTALHAFSANSCDGSSVAYTHHCNLPP